MPVYHRTQRLQIFGEKPEIQKLYGSRYRMVVRCVAKNDTKAWYDDNKAQIFADFGSLYSAQMSVDGIDARTGEAYDDMVLVKNEATYTRSGEYVIIFTYETLTDSFVQETEDKVDFDLNGLKRLTRTIIAKDTVAYSSVVGTSTTGTSPLLTLAQVSEDQLEASEDGFKRIQEVWLESGTLSETIDNVGSQKAKVIETIGADPSTPSGYSLASKQESDFEGFQTNRFTFLKDNVELSRSEDKVGSQLAITTQVFNPTSDPTESGYSLARKEVSDVDGIPTKRFTFLKDNVVLSESEDKVGSQLAIVQEVFNGTPSTPSGYSIANTQESDVDGIPTKRYTFLKDNVILSESADKVGSQLAITQEVFNGTPVTPSGYSIASEQVSDVDGIPTKRYTFLKDDVQLSQTEDRVGSQLAISQQWFNPNANKTLAGYSLASKNTSDFEGIETVEYRFLKNNVELSRSEDLVGSQLAITTEVFKPDADPTEAGYSLARTDISDVDGIPTERFTFLKDNVELSRSSDLVGSQKAITVEIFKPDSDPTETDYVIARTEVSDVEGIPTKRFTFLKDNVELSRSEDKVGSQLAITTEVFKPDADPTEEGYSVARTEVSDVEGIPTKRFTFLKDNVILSVTQDKVGSQESIINEVFNPDTYDFDGVDEDNVTLTGYVEASRQASDFEGIETVRYAFLKKDVKLSASEDKVGSQNAIVEEWFKPETERDTKPNYSLARKEESDVEGIPTERYTFLEDNVELSRSEDKVGSQLAIVTEVFKPDADPTEAGYVIARTEVSDVEGIPTKRFTFLKEDVELSRSEDKVGSQLAITTEVFKPTSDPTETGYSVARTEVSDVDGIPTKRYTFLKEDVKLSASEDEVGSQNAITEQWFKPNGSRGTKTGYSLARKEESDVGGIPTERYTFLKDDVELSRSSDLVGSQKAIVTEVFKPSADPTETGYSVARTEVSDVDGIPTKRFTFLKNDVELSRSNDYVGSQLSITREFFNPTSDPTESGYSLASKQQSDFEGIKTIRYIFLKDDVILSKSEDKVGSQNAITEQWFKPSESSDDPVVVGRDQKTGYSLARREKSDVGGIPTERYTFLKDNVELSRSSDLVGSQKAIVTEVFKPTADPTETGYSVARTEVSDVDGIPTKRFTFLKDNVELSRSSDLVGSQKAITTEVFKPTSDPTESGYSVARTEVSDVEGIPTKRFTFLKDNVVLSVSEDKVSSQNAVVNEVFNPTSEAITGIGTSGTALVGYSEANRTESDYEGIKTIRVQFLKNNVVLGRSIQTKSGGNLILEVVEVFNGTPVAETTGAVKIGDEVSDVDGIPTRRFTFAKGEGQISVDSRPAPAQLAGCTYVTVRSLGTAVTPTGAIVAESETESDGYITYEKTALQGTITGTKQTYKDVVDVTVAGVVNCTSVSKTSGGISGTIAVTQVTPPRTKTLAATVTVEVTTSPPDTVSLAYDLGDISCSVTSISMSENFRGTDVFTTSSGNSRYSGQRKAADMSARVSTYPNCYLSSSVGSGVFSYTSSYQNDSTSPNSIVANAQTSTTKTFTDGTGSTSASYSTTGVVERSSRPILTDLSGTTYYEVVTWTV